MYYKYTRAAYDCFCAPGTHISNIQRLWFSALHVYYSKVQVERTGQASSQ